MTLVIFDVDGTLIYSERRDSLCFATAYEEVFGREFPTIDWRQYPHVTDTVIFETVMDGHFQRKPSEQELQDFHGLYLQKLIASRKENPHFFKEVPGARSLVERLSQMEDVSLAIATGRLEAAGGDQIRACGHSGRPHADQCGGWAVQPGGHSSKSDPVNRKS
jgi:beta-phosphoglucomutase-like phosphatase (HAD superfamily)